MNFLSNKSKRHKILIVEDNAFNRELLFEMLKEDYDVIAARDGAEGIKKLKKYREKLSLVLLDVYMPVCDGFEFLRIAEEDPYLSSVPIIVTTRSDNREDEEKCLKLGATDFITKPYQAEVLLGRIGNIIRYRETLSTLAVVEYDDLTGLYTMSAFFHHAGQIISEDEGEFDLVVWHLRDLVDIYSLFGEKRGSELMKYTASEIEKFHLGAMIAIKDNHFFMLGKAEKRLDTQTFRNEIKSICGMAPVRNLRISAGVYINIDKKVPISVTCERLLRGLKYSYAEGEYDVIYYNEQYEKKWLRERQIIMNFSEAVKNEEFSVKFQPKVDAESGKIISAEALVRWTESDGSIISPGEFIPVLEEEAMIHLLDELVFRKVCRFQGKRKEKGLDTVPVSVNVSRHSLYRDNIIENYKKIAEEENIELADVPLEVTETSIVSDENMLKTCGEFAKSGFKLHMDDFGSGYSSLFLLTELPVSELKIDKSLIDHIESRKGAIVIRSIIEMAKDLDMKVVAEGVERESQASLLKKMKCDMIQGYLYYMPMDEREFEGLL
jgi:EAL domain-containing protein (putative c-di-GMP-specific phosphodiesterase class I)/DNA-binding response OmpR family regulator